MSPIIMNQVDIDKLNIVVEKVVAVEASKLEKNVNEKTPNDLKAVLIDKRIVYKNRTTWIPLLFIVLGLAINTVNLAQGNVLQILLSMTLMFFWYDFLSGVLHMVLDNPEFINFPIINDSCLEFQWHHRIPTDIISKSFLQVCGDLNMIMIMLLCFYLLPKSIFCCEYRSSLGVLMVFNKILMSYFGQYCHRMSHMPSHRRPALVAFLQDIGIMISSKEHLKHHQSYDNNFCIGSGVCNYPLRLFSEKVAVNKYSLLIFFVLALFGDIPVFMYLLGKLNMT